MDQWEYEPARDLELPPLERLRQFPREPDMLVYGLRGAAAFASRSWLRLYHRLAVSGSENLPTTESYVLVANHASHLDALCMLAALPFAKLHQAFPAAAKDYFFVNVPRLLFAAVAVNALPFNRLANPRQSLTLCRQLLERPGNVLILFPEGTRSATGELGDFKPGIGLLLAGTEFPVVPCHLEGTHAAWPKGGWFPRPKKIRMQIGTPRHYSALAPGKESALHICRELRDDVAALSSAPQKESR